MANILKLLLLMIFMLSIFCNPVYAVEKEEIRVRAGLDLFPSLLAADIGIENKKGADGTLLLVLLYNDDMAKAQEMASHLGKVDRIRNIPLKIEVLDARSLDQLKSKKPAGLFLSQSVQNNLDDIIAYGRKHEIIVFSPFEGDVERGVLGGIYISDRLLPFINTSAAQLANIKIKPFFLRVSVQYEK